MPFFDLDNFIRAAQAILAGRDIYALPDVYYPLPLYLIFLPLASLPPPVAHTIWTGVEAIIFVAILRRRALSVVLFMPVVLTFLMGQVVMPMFGLFALLRSGLFGGVALALLVLKPQLVFFLAPWQLWQWWVRDRRQILVFTSTLGCLAICAFVIQPDWLVRWLSVSGQRNRAAISPSLWGLLSFLPGPIWIAIASTLTVALFIWAWRRSDFDILAVAGFLANPLIISYDLSLLTVIGRNTKAWLVFTVLSWVTFAVSAWQGREGAVCLITVAVLALLLLRKEARKVNAAGVSNVNASLGERV